MEFPFGHPHHRHPHHHHHGHGGEEKEEARRTGEPYYPPPGQNPHRPDAHAARGWEEHQRPPPPPHYGSSEGGYAGWDVRQGPHVAYESGVGYPAVQHVAHEVRPVEEEGGGGYEGWRHGHGGHGGPFSFVHHVSHESSGAGYPAVQHVAHEVRPVEEERGGGHEGWRHGHGRHGGPFSFVHHVSHESSGAADGAPAHGRTVRVFTKAAENYSLSIRDGKVILARADHRDEYQHWIKDEKFSTRVKDEEGLPSFALINKVTGEAIKHSIGPTHPVRLIPYNPNYLDESILWTESHNTGEGFRCIRMVNNIRLNFDAFHGDEDHGGVHDGTIVVLWEWLKGKNQRWKIVPY